MILEFNNMLITPQQIGLFLSTFPFEKNKSLLCFFQKKSTLRMTLEQLRGEFEINRSYSNLTPQEMEQFEKAISSHIEKNRVSDFVDVDNQLINALICEFLLTFELAESPKKKKEDGFYKIIIHYFNKLAQELNFPQNIQNSPLQIWLQHLKLNPQFYLDHLFIGGNGNSYRFPLLDLAECGCINVSHDRLLGNVRTHAENLVLDTCKKLHEDQPIKIISMGPGEGLQEFVLIWKLFQMGRMNIQLCLVEPDYQYLLIPDKKTVNIWDAEWSEEMPLPEKYLVTQQKKFYPLIEALSLLNRGHEKANLSLSLYPAIQYLVQEKHLYGEFDIVYGIDMEDCAYNDSKAKQDFQQATTLLKNGGKAILSYHYQIETFDIQKESQNVNIKHDMLQLERVQPVKNEYQIKNPIESFFKI